MTTSRYLNTLTKPQVKLVRLLLRNTPEAQHEAVELLSHYTATQCLEVARILRHLAALLRASAALEHRMKGGRHELN